MRQPEQRRLTREEVRELEVKIPNRDALPDQLGVRSHFGSIEAAEEKHFPWLRDRRRRRRS